MFSMGNFNPNTSVDLVNTRLAMIKERQEGEKVKDLLIKYHVSKPVFHKFYKRYQEYGRVGLYNLSKAPLNHGTKTSEDVERELEAFFSKYPYFNPYELHDLTGLNVMTIYRILKRRGLRRVYKSKKEKKKVLRELKENHQKKIPRLLRKKY